MQKPSLGRVVIVPMDPDFNNGADEAPATITRVWSDELVNVKVTGDNPDAAEWRTSVKLLAERPSEPPAGLSRFAWWPPRVS